MTSDGRKLSRRAFLVSVAAIAAVAPCSRASALPAPGTLRRRTIPGTEESLPVIGMGSWITFNVGGDRRLRDARSEVLRAFFENGGGLIDSSPMYGSSEAVIGYGLERLGYPDGLFSATKVWTPLQAYGRRQIRRSHELWGEQRFDLLQIHNLLNWEGHLETLREQKAAGNTRYIGVTTSHGRRHELLEKVMAEPDIDFVQFTYNLFDREAEARLLPLAAERGLAVIINRPFRGGALFDRVARKPLPEWAAEFDCENWAQYFLKFIVSHPAVTCAIPATSRVDHMLENMGALRGRLPDPDLRARM